MLHRDEPVQPRLVSKQRIAGFETRPRGFDPLTFGSLVVHLQGLSNVYEALEPGSIGFCGVVSADSGTRFDSSWRVQTPRRTGSCQGRSKVHPSPRLGRLGAQWPFSDDVPDDANLWVDICHSLHYM